MVVCSSSLFIWSLGMLCNVPPYLSRYCYVRRHLVGSGFLCVWGIHTSTSLGVIRKERLGEMSFRWTPFLFYIPKSKPGTVSRDWPTNLFLPYFCSRGILGILGWARLRRKSICQLGPGQISIGKYMAHKRWLHQILFWNCMVWLHASNGSEITIWMVYPLKA
ncbi:hypothetical protein Hanom_Chr10g00963321 [Helianthus anomalus]